MLAFFLGRIRSWAQQPRRPVRPNSTQLTGRRLPQRSVRPDPNPTHSHFRRRDTLPHSTFAPSSSHSPASKWCRTPAIAGPPRPRARSSTRPSPTSPPPPRPSPSPVPATPPLIRSPTPLLTLALTPSSPPRRRCTTPGSSLPRATWIWRPERLRGSEVSWLRLS
jgi:hypothetical protein